MARLMRAAASETDVLALERKALAKYRSTAARAAQPGGLRVPWWAALATGTTGIVLGLVLDNLHLYVRL